MLLKLGFLCLKKVFSFLIKLNLKYACNLLWWKLATPSTVSFMLRSSTSILLSCSFKRQGVPEIFSSTLLCCFAALSRARRTLKYLNFYQTSVLLSCSFKIQGVPEISIYLLHIYTAQLLFQEPGDPQTSILLNFLLEFYSDQLLFQQPGVLCIDFILLSYSI